MPSIACLNIYNTEISSQQHSISLPLFEVNHIDTLEIDSMLGCERPHVTLLPQNADGAGPELISPEQKAARGGLQLARGPAGPPVTPLYLCLFYPERGASVDSMTDAL